MRIRVNVPATKNYLGSYRKVVLAHVFVRARSMQMFRADESS
jgi:hypothetical protein